METLISTINHSLVLQRYYQGLKVIIAPAVGACTVILIRLPVEANWASVSVILYIVFLQV